MSKLIIEPNGLLTPAHDPYWDAPITRREIQMAVNELAANDRELTMRADTANIVLNFLMEKQGITRPEVDAWIVQKKAQIAAARVSQAAAGAWEERHYSDGSSASGPGPLPELSPGQQAQRDKAK